MPFGGGSKWAIKYGEVQFYGTKNPFGQIEYGLIDGHCYSKSSNGTVIPKYLDTKKEVMELISKIGIF